MKICWDCKQEKPLEAFYPNRAKVNGRSAQCIQCSSACNKRKYQANREKYLSKNREHYHATKAERQKQIRAATLKTKYNLTPEEYDEMLDLQGGVCAICKQTETSTDNQSGVTKFRRLAVDHNHETGKVRGLLCGACNRGMGFLRDDVDILKNVIAYIQQSNS